MSARWRKKLRDDDIVSHQPKCVEYQAGAMTTSLHSYLPLVKAEVSNRYSSEVHKQCYLFQYVGWIFQLCMASVNV
jgi:hypothetical protein